MPGPFDPLSELTNTYAAEDYMAQRKRLREARARWIEEHECPTDYAVKDKDGSTFKTPFQVGKRTYEGEYPQTPDTAFKPTFQPDDKKLTWDKAQKDLKPILDETERFLAPGIYRESAHPEIKEGESYGEYCARIGREYEQATGANAVRRPVSDSDGVRESAVAHPSGERGVPASGAGDRERVGEGIRGNADPDDSGGAQSGDAGDDGAGKGSSADADGTDRNPPG